MKGRIPFLAILLLSACQPSPTSTSTALPTAIQHSPPAPTDTAWQVQATATLAPAVPAATATAVPDASPAPGPLPAPPGPLPLLAAEVTLGPPVSACVGENLVVADDGTVYTLGRRDDQPCASAIDLATGAVEPADPATLPAPTGSVLQVSDPAGGRTYVAAGGVVTAYAADGQEIGPVLTLPPGDPEGFSASTLLRLNETADRLYLSYQDFDYQAWIALADLTSGETIADVPVPPGPWTLKGERLFFANANTLVVLDGATLELTDRLALSRRPASAVVDPAGARLFVADAGGDLHVLDPVTLAELERLPAAGSAVDLDPRLGRLYVGDRYSGAVHVFDLDTLAALGRIPQPGRPAASPADGLLYILEEDVYRADGATLELISGRSVRFSSCNGCTYPTGVVVDPTSGLVYETTYSVWVGKPGRASEAAVDPLSGRAFIARTTGGYQVGYSLAAYPDLSLSGEPARWVDGLYGQLLYNPVSAQLYLASSGGRLIILDGRTLELLGALNVGVALDLLAVDGASGQFYAAGNERLLRFEPLGAFPERPRPVPVTGLPGSVYGIVVSPNFAQDSTLFTRATDWETYRSGFYRSRDAGKSWQHLRGGLPGPPNDLLWAADGRLYAALVPVDWHATAEAATWGEGVYVSEDGGDTWRPDDAGLAHLRVGQLHSAADGTLYALAAAAPEPGHAASGPTIWTRPPGQDWTLLEVPAAGSLRLVNYAIPTTYTLAVKAHWHDLTGGGPLYQGWGGELHRSDDGGQTWEAVGPGPADYANSVLGGRDAVYWLGSDGLWRSSDEGATWAVSRHPALADGPPSLVLVADVEGVETLFLGTKAGQVLIWPATAAEWAEPPPAPTPTLTPSVPTPTAAPLICEYGAADVLAAVWEASQERLGCPAQPAAVRGMAYQPFEGGVMIWDGADPASIYAGLAASGDWVSRADHFREGDPESDPALVPPSGLLQPVRGFGLLWRGDENLRQALGWALAPEAGFEGTWQAFDGGYAVAGPDGRAWLFYLQGAPRWEALLP